MRTLAIDPGGKTGIATYNTETAEFDSYEVPSGLEGFTKHYWTCGGREWFRTFDDIVMERFLINAGTFKKSPQYDALYIIGFVLGVAQIHGPNVVLQTPVQRKFATDDKLKQMLWHRPSQGGHMNDAARHLLTFLVKQKDPRVVQRLSEMV